MAFPASSASRAARRYCAALLCACAAGCSSPAGSGAAGGEEALRGTRLASNPFLADGDQPSRDAIAAAYFEERGIAFEATAVRAWTPLDERAALLLRVRNGGPLPCTFVARRSRGVWPWRDEEHACVRLEVEAVLAAARTGQQATRATLHFDDFEDLVVAPGAEAAIEVVLEWTPPPGAQVATAGVTATLHPLAIRCGDEPERVIALRFDEVVLGFAPAAVATAAPGDDAPWRRALEELPEHLPAAALRRAETAGRVAVVDELILALPGRDAPARRARSLALEWLTGRRLGDSVERWRSWWESRDYAAFAAAEAARR